MGQIGYFLGGLWDDCNELRDWRLGLHPHLSVDRGRTDLDGEVATGVAEVAGRLPERARRAQRPALVASRGRGLAHAPRVLYQAEPAALARFYVHAYNESDPAGRTIIEGSTVNGRHWATTGLSSRRRQTGTAIAVYGGDEAPL